jgi:putative NAD(P)H quinone oxidoreductase, PIG3 family
LKFSGTIVGNKKKIWTKVLFGKEVCALLTGGGYAEYVACNISTVLPVPDGIPLLDACTIPETFFTVWTNLFDQGALKKDESLLIHGGASGIGLTAISMAKALNVKCFATVGSSEKKDFIDKLNIERCINYQIEDFEKIIKNDYSGVDVILDIVGGEYFQKNINILNKYGRLINIAYLKGSKVEVDLIPIMLKRLLISGSTLRVRSDKEKQEIANQLRENIWPLIENKTIELFIDKKYEKKNVRDAHKYMENNKGIGKILLNFNRPCLL